MSRAVMQQALDVLEDIEGEWGFISKRTVPKRIEAIAALRKELDHIPDAGKMAGPERQPLTDEECVEAIDASFEFALASGNVSNTSVIRYARVIEAKHGIKEQP